MKKNIKQHYTEIKEMYEKGCPIAEISKTFDIGKDAIYNAISIMGISKRVKAKNEEVKTLVYADNRKPVLEKLIIDGKRYTDITPIFAPR